MVAEDRKRSHLQTDWYFVNGKSLLIQRIPGPSDFWADATSAGKVFTIIFIVAFTLIYSVMEHYDLHIGGIASEQQLRLGNFATEAEQTGPRQKYSLEAVDVVKAEAVRQDPRIKAVDVQEELTPERYPTFYPGIRDTRRGYIGNGQFQFCFSYITRTGSKYERVSGSAIVRLTQDKVWFMVRQRFIIDEYRITNRYIN